MRLKFGVAITAALAVLSSALVGIEPAHAATYPTSITTSGSTTRTDISDAELATSSNSVTQRYAIQNQHNGIYYFGADPANASKIIIRSYKDGALDTGFAGGTGQVSFTAQLASSGRTLLEMATYNNGANWMILESNFSAGTGLNYMYLGSYASGYSSTVTLPIGNDFYNTYCQSKPSAGFTQLGGGVSVIQQSPYSVPTLMLTCNAYVTTVAGGTSAYDYLVTVSGGTTLGTPGTYSFVSSTSLTPLADTTNKSVVRVGYSAWAGATGTQPKMTFFYVKSTASSPPSAPSAYTTTAWADRVVSRISAGAAVSSTTSAWTGVSVSTYTGTLMIPPTNNGTIYAIAHATDTATSAMKVITFGATGAGSAGTSTTGSTGPLGRAEIVAAATPGSLQKVACKDGGSGGYWEVEGTTAAATAGGGFTSSGIGSADAFYWIPSEDSNGVSMFTRTSTTNIARLAFTTAPIAPSTPAAPTATRGDGQVSLSWTAPANGGAAISDYQIDYSSNSGSSWDVFADGTSSATTATVTGLTNGTSYVFRIRAVNSAGTSSSSSASTAVTPAAVTSAPTGVAGNFGNAQVALSWTAPATNNGSAITDYTIQYSSNGGTSWTTWTHTASTAASATITGLTNGTAYTFKVAAVNGIGTSAYSTVSSSITPATLPSTMSAPTAVAGDGQVTLSWTAPSANGCVITDYDIDITTNNGSTYSTYLHSPSDATTQTITGLTNGTSYRFRVAAANCAGSGTMSALSTAVVPNPVPSQTTGLTVTTNGQSNQLVLSWTAPSGNGSAVTDYLIEYSTNGGTSWTPWTHSASTATSATLTGLTNGASYSFRVSAINGIGTGTASTTSTAVTAIALPGALASAPSATASPGQVALTWSAPSSNGGAAITDYLIEYSTNGGTSWSTYADGTSTATSATITGLTTGLSYLFRVSAINSLGTATASSASSSVTAQAATAPSTVGQPTVILASNPGDVVLSWTAPAANGSAITDYVIEYSTNGTTWTTFNDGTSTATSATVTGLTLGTSYQFRVKAVNGIGTATASTSTSSTPVVAVPSAIASAPSVVSSPGQVALTWSAPSSTGGSAITDYLIQYSSDGGNTWSTWSHTASTATSATITGLTATSNYSFKISAVNSVGASTASTVSQTVTALAPTAPGAVATPTSTPGTNAGEVDLTWTAPAANGSAMTDYLVQYSPDGGTTWITFNDGTSTSTSTTITGLTLGVTYTFRVQAINSIGSGSASNGSASLPVITVPGTFSSAVSAVASPGSVALTWTAPSSNGGSVITDYLIEYSSDGGHTWLTYSHTASTATSATITGLTSGSTYTFRVSAINAAGTGPVSTVAIPVVAQAATAPGAVGQPTATAGTNPGEVVLTWTAPAANGSAITDYLIEYSPDGGTTWLTFSDGTSSATTATITGLTVGTSYVFRITAINGVGTANAGSTSASQTPAAVIQAPPAPASPTIPTVNPRHVPGRINFASQTGDAATAGTFAGGPVAIEGTNMDMILVVLIGNRSAHVVTQTETRIVVTPAKTVFGFADVTLVYALGSISFPRAVNISDPGPGKISLNSFWKHKVSERSAKTLLSVWPTTGGATSVMCVAKYTKRSNRALAMWRAKRVCSMLRVNRPELDYKVAVARKFVKAQLELRIKY